MVGFKLNLVVRLRNHQIKSAKSSYLDMYDDTWQYCTELPNLNLLLCIHFGMAIHSLVSKSLSFVSQLLNSTMLMMVVHHQLLCQFDHIPQSWDNQIFDGHSRPDSKSSFVGLLRVKWAYYPTCTCAARSKAIGLSVVCQHKNWQISTFRRK